MKQVFAAEQRKSFSEQMNLLTDEGPANHGENRNRAKHDDKSDCHANRSDDESQQNYGLDTGSEGRETELQRQNNDIRIVAFKATGAQSQNDILC